MSSSPTPTTTPASLRSKKVLIPKVWKRPHSTIYGKNVEFGSSLYSDKIGELNGRKFNSELPWSVRNSGGSSAASASGSSSYNQGYLSNLLVDPRDISACSNYADLLAITNPNRLSSSDCMGSSSIKYNSNSDRRNRNSRRNLNKRIDFYANYLEFSKEIDRLSGSSLLKREPLLTRKMYDHFLDYDYELGLFVPAASSLNNNSSSKKDNYSGNIRSYYDDDNFRSDCSLNRIRDYNLTTSMTDINTIVPPSQSTLNNSMDAIQKRYKNNYLPLPINQLVCNTHLLPKHKCQIGSSPYGQTADGRKLSLSSINPHSYRPSLPAKTSTAHASDGEEFEFQDKSSPFYTDRWAGKTIRHFDSDLYSNANLFKSMIL